MDFNVWGGVVGCWRQRKDFWLPAEIQSNLKLKYIRTKNKARGSKFFLDPCVSFTDYTV